MSIVATALKAEMQTRLDAMTSPSSPIDILARATEAVDLGLDTTKLVTVINEAIALVDNTTSSDDVFNLVAAKLAVETEKSPYLRNRQIIETSQNFTVPDGVYTIFVTLVGGGDVGGTAYGANRYGSGGNAGAVLLRWRLDVTPGAIILATVGVGGSEGVAAGNTTFGGLTAKAGEGKKAQVVDVEDSNPSRGAEGFHYGKNDRGAGAGGDGSVGNSSSYGYRNPGQNGVVIVEWY